MCQADPCTIRHMVEFKTYWSTLFQAQDDTITEEKQLSCSYEAYLAGHGYGQR